MTWETIGTAPDLPIIETEAIIGDLQRLVDKYRRLLSRLQGQAEIEA